MRIRIFTENRSRGVFGRRHVRVLEKAARTAFLAQGVFEDCILNVVLTDDNEIRRINREFRHLDKATDVLSFPMNEFLPGAYCGNNAERDPETGAVNMGDMVISCEHVIAQAEEYGHSVYRELAYLTIHSCLHLLGYDHVDEGEEKRCMRAREEYIIGKTPFER